MSCFVESRPTLIGLQLQVVAISYHMNIYIFYVLYVNNMYTTQNLQGYFEKESNQVSYYKMAFEALKMNVMMGRGEKIMV